MPLVPGLAFLLLAPFQFVPAGCAQLHRRGVPEHVGRDTLLPDRRTSLGGSRRVLVHQRPKASRLSAPRRVEGKTGSMDVQRLTGQRDAALLAALAGASDVGVLAPDGTP